MEKVRVGIVGTGVGIRTHLPGFRRVGNAEVIAIAGSSLARSQEFAEKYNVPRACANYRELCDMADVDLVCITAPNRYHFEMVKYALSKMKHIICEKPVSEDKKEIAKLELLVRDYPRLVVVDHQLRYNPYMTMIKTILREGGIGIPYLVRINQEGVGFSKIDAKWTWSFDGQQGGGVRLAMASHFNDLIQYWFGNRLVLAVSGNLNPVFKNRIDNEGVPREVTASTICSAKIDLADELSVMYTINAGAYRKFIFEIDIYGDNGQLHFDLDNKLSIYRRSAIGMEEKVDVGGVFEDERMNKVSLFSGSFRYFAPMIVAAVLGNQEAIKRSARINDAIYNCDLLDAILTSANSGESVVFTKRTNRYV